jgi:hypothetical protein
MIIAIKKIAAGSAMLLMLSAISVSAQSPAPPSRRITPEQAQGSQGQSVTVEGVASLSDAHGMPEGTFIRLSTTGRGAAFAGYVAAGNYNRFPDLRDLDGRVISITGVVETTSTIPIIRLTSADQIRIVR